MAQVVLAQKLADAGLDVEVDSAAVSSEERGNPIDFRAARVLRDAGYQVPRRCARQVRPSDFVDYDLILPMTRSHERTLQRMEERWNITDPVAEIRRFRTFNDDGVDDVPDPWYGDAKDFYETLDIIEDAVPAISEYVRESA